MNYLDIMTKYLFLISLPALLFFAGCSPRKPLIHNEAEAIQYSKKLLIDFCKEFKCTPEKFDAPIKVDDMTSYSKDYSWYVQFSQLSQPEIAVYFNVSPYGRYETSALLEEDYIKRKTREKKDRKENPWKYN